MSETFLIHSSENDSNRLTIDGYNLLRSDNPSNLNKGRVCNYYKEHISLFRKDDFCAWRNFLVVMISSLEVIA